MHPFANALRVEALKLRRSKVPWLAGLGSLLAPLMAGLFMLILKDPQWALRSGLISTKAKLMAGSADWPAFLQLITQAVAIGGLILFGLVLIWSFGREYSERTGKDLLALPTSRAAIVAAKFIVAAMWAAAVTAIIYAFALGIGAALGLPGWSPELALQSAGRMPAAAAMTFCVAMPFALAASAGRGYLPAFGFMFFSLFSAQILAALGWGEFFPWSVPALYTGVAGPGTAQLGALSYLLVALTGLAGMIGTMLWWELADQA